MQESNQFQMADETFYQVKEQSSPNYVIDKKNKSTTVTEQQT